MSAFDHPTELAYAQIRQQELRDRAERDRLLAAARAARRARKDESRKEASPGERGSARAAGPRAPRSLFTRRGSTAA